MIETAGGIGINYVKRSGYGDFPLNTSNWTIFFRFKQPSTPSVFIAPFIISAGVADYSNPYIFFGTATVNTDILNLDSYNGTSFAQINSFTATNGAQAWCAVTYDSSIHQLALIVNGSVIGTVTQNLNAVIWDRIFIFNDETGTGDAGACSVAYCRAWSRILNSGELTSEAASINAVSMTGLLWDCPLQSSIDLTSHNNTLNQFVATGTVTTDTSDPLLSIVAGPPTNTSAVMATEAFSTTAVFQNVVASGAATDVWYKYNPIIGSKVISFMAFSSNYIPKITVWDDLANTGSIGLALQASNNKEGLQLQSDVTKTYYIKVTATTTPATATLEFSILEILQLTVGAGSYAINDDSETLTSALILLDRTTGYPQNAITSFARGEGSWIFSTGLLLVSNEHVDNTVILYNSGYGVVATIPITNMTAKGFQSCRISGSESQLKYIVASFNAANSLRITIINSDGTIADTYTIATTGLFLTGFGVLPDFTKAYITISDSTNKPVKTIDLVTKTYTTDLNAGLANYASGRDILCQGTNVILVPYIKSSATQSLLVKKYDGSGTVLATGNYDAYVNDSTDVLDVRMCWYTDTNSFIIWVKGLHTGYSTILRVNTATLAVIESTSTIAQLNQYEDGKQFGTITNTPLRFGHSESCPIFVTQVGSFPPGTAKSGLYTVSGTGAAAETVNPLIRHDQDWIDTHAGTSENVKIPDPYYDTYLAGDE